MKMLKWILINCCLLMCAYNAYAQPGGLSQARDEFIPEAIYEVRYWTNMAASGDNAVYIDTMIFHNDRAVFEYSSENCLSYHCRRSDSLVYVLMPKFGSEKEWIMGSNYVRKDHMVSVPFRGYERGIYKMYTTDMVNKDTGIGEYALVSREFGIIFRYNSDGEVFMLNRIDVLRNGKIMDEIDLLPLQVALGKTDIFTGSSGDAK